MDARKSLLCFISFVRDPKQMLHVTVLLVCCFVSMYQLFGCISKLRHPPVATHNKFVVNETLNYPAITICRHPAYKTNVLKSFNLGYENSDVTYTSEWKNFPFENASLQDVWDQATYTQSEVLNMYGLHGHAENVKILKRYYFFYGQCFTMLPRAASNKPWPNSGWSILLKHDNKKMMKYGIRSSTITKGFNVFIHEVREPWTENNMQANFIMQHLFVEVGDEYEIKITAEQYNSISTNKEPCVRDINYSRSKCIEKNRWLNISKTIGCTGPWMPDVHLPYCKNYEQMKNLITQYRNFNNNNDWGCSRACNTTTYKLFLVKRGPIPKPYSHIFVYYASKLVVVMEEFPGYDANNFLADIGGSFGFFLGLSVIGTIGLLEKCLQVIFCYAKPLVLANKTLPELEKY